MKNVFVDVYASAAVMAVLSLFSIHGNAQPGEPVEEPVEEIVTTAIHNRESETALPITILSGDELHKQARATLGETLANQPGINNASFGPGVGQIVIRGQQGRRVLNMSNGVSNADASGNSADHALTAEAILADSIEVLRGPSTLLYGGGAIGGVVNVIDSRIARMLPDEPQVNMEVRHSSASDQSNVIGSFNFATGSIAWHIDGLRREWNNLEIPGFAISSDFLEAEEEHEHENQGEDEHEEEIENTDEFIANTGGESNAYTLGASWVFDSGYIGVAVSSYENLYGLPPGSHHHEEGEDEHEEEENIRIDMSRTRYDMIGEWSQVSSLLEKVDFRLSYTDYEHKELEGPGAIGTVYSNDSWQQRLQLTHRPLFGWHGVLGLQGLEEEFSAFGEESFIPLTEVSSWGMFLVEDYHRGIATFELGARVNNDNYRPENTTAPDKGFSTFSFSTSLLLDISDPVSLGVSISHSERAPSIEELYSNEGLENIEACVIHLATASCEVGDDSLDKEKSLNMDIQLTLDLGNFGGTLTAFYNDFGDYIYQHNSGIEVGESPLRNYQQNDAHFSGIELEMMVPLSTDWQLRLFGDMIDSHINTEGDVPRMPPYRFGSDISYNTGKWSSYLSFLHAASQSNPGNNELPSASYTRWDLGTEYNFELSQAELLFFIRLHNLTNEEIRLSTSYLRDFAPEAGRSIETGIRLVY